MNINVITTAVSPEKINDEIMSVHLYDELSFNGRLYETAVKTITWVLDMNPKDVDEWIELHSRSHASHEDAQKWLDFNESNRHNNDEWNTMLVLLSEHYENVKKIRGMDRLEKAAMIGSMIEAAIDPKTNGIF